MGLTIDKDRDDYIPGATDDTLIGNVNDSLKVHLTGLGANTSSDPRYSVKARCVLAPTQILLSDTETLIYSYSGSGTFASCHLVFEDDKASVRIVIDGNEILPYIPLKTATNKTFFDDSNSIFIPICIRAAGKVLQFQWYTGIPYTTNVSIYAKHEVNLSKNLECSSVFLTKET